MHLPLHRANVDPEIAPNDCCKSPEASLQCGKIFGQRSLLRAENARNSASSQQHVVPVHGDVDADIAKARVAPGEVNVSEAVQCPAAALRWLALGDQKA